MEDALLKPVYTMNEAPLECLVISDFTIESLAGLLENSEAPPRCHVAIAPYDQVNQVILQADHDGWSTHPQAAVVWTRPERVSPSFAKALLGEVGLEQRILEEVEAFCDVISTLEGRVSHCFIPTWAPTLPGRGLGVRDLKSDAGIGYLLARMNLHLMQRFFKSRSFFVLDTARWLQATGKWAYHPKSWYLAKIPFGNEVFALAAGEIKAGLRALAGQTKKLVVVDLDETLWGGVLGEVGWENLVLGGHDAFGEAFADFQNGLKALRQRGVLLAICSKNEEATALEAIEKHPEMRLRRDDFVSWRINWNDKAANIAELVHELRLGLDSVVFLDDNPAERNRVREALPEIFVPEIPEDKMLVASFLRKLDCFDNVSLSEADQARTLFYQTEREREVLRGAVRSLDEWLEQLQTSILVEPLNDRNWDRALQLLNKTNQMNLRTRRLTDLELKTWTSVPQNQFWTVRVSDCFGDSGLSGLMSLSVKGGCAQIVDFVLSCRVMGRRIEEAMLHLLKVEARERGLGCLEAEYIPTQKNGPCLRFFEASGASKNGNLLSWNPGADCQPPKSIAIERVVTKAQVC